MKAILMSIQPEWCELIASGKKTIEVRKTAPKDTPFKVYIYQSKWHWIYKILPWLKDRRQKVIGEFVCDKVEKFLCTSVPYRRYNNLGYGNFLDDGVYKVDGLDEAMICERDDKYIDSMLNNNDLKAMCLSAQELFDYVGAYKHFYGFHISNLKIYDKPKELWDFRKPCSLTCADYSNKKGDCETCGELQVITRPPQSWMFVEEIEV